MESLAKTLLGKNKSTQDGENSGSAGEGSNHKDSNQQQQHQHHDTKAEGRDGETLDNNVDPARNPVNPQVISQSDFLRNSLTYGMNIPTGRTSTWDRPLSRETDQFHAALMKTGHKETLERHIAHHRAAIEARKGDYSTPDHATSINNFLAGEVSGLGEGASVHAEGRQRGADTQEPAHHFDFHEPTVHDRVHGAANIVAGKVRMDQDIATRGRAEFGGETIDGH